MIITGAETHRHTFIIAIFLMFCACSPVSIKHDEKAISIDKTLLNASDYIDIVYENGIFSYLSYMRKEDIAEDLRMPLCNCKVPKIPPHSNGVWLWNYKAVAGKEKAVLDKLLENNFKKIYIQISGNLTNLKPFLQHAKDTGIEVFALDGSPDYINDYQVLIDRINLIKEFNQTNRDISFTGMQIDVEPYLKKDFNLKKEQYIMQYLKMARTLKIIVGDKLKLSFALPFWFDSLTAEGKPLSFHIIDIADEVVIMSYRTEYDEILDSSCNELCYAGSVNKMVFFGLEINKLPDEQHFIINKEDILKLPKRDNGFILSGAPYTELPVHKKYEVKSERITFFNKKNALESILNKTPMFKSFSGYIIHSLEGLYE